MPGVEAGRQAGWRAGGSAGRLTGRHVPTVFFQLPLPAHNRKAVLCSCLGTYWGARQDLQPPLDYDDALRVGHLPGAPGSCTKGLPTPPPLTKVNPAHMVLSAGPAVCAHASVTATPGQSTTLLKHEASSVHRPSATGSHCTALFLCWLAEFGWLGWLGLLAGGLACLHNKAIDHGLPALASADVRVAPTTAQGAL